jgi:TetR/AcrR family acrAB operon transcriptional repressor
LKNSNDRPTRILDAASRLMVHYGFDKTTMEDIAREAGVSKGALYLVWPSKDALVDGLIAREMKRVLADLQSRLDQDSDREIPFIAALYKHTLLALEHNPLARALYTRDARILGDYIHRQDVSRYTGRLDLSAGVVRQMQAAGLLDPGIRPDTLAYLFSLITYGFAGISALLPAQAAPPLEETADALARLVTRGVALPGGDRALGKEAIQQLIASMNADYSTPGQDNHD